MSFRALQAQITDIIDPTFSRCKEFLIRIQADIQRQNVTAAPYIKAFADFEKEIFVLTPSLAEHPDNKDRLNQVLQTYTIKPLYPFDLRYTIEQAVPLNSNGKMFQIFVSKWNPVRFRFLLRPVPSHIAALIQADEPATHYTSLPLNVQLYPPRPSFSVISNTPLLPLSVSPDPLPDQSSTSCTPTYTDIQPPLKSLSPIPTVSSSSSQLDKTSIKPSSIPFVSHTSPPFVLNSSQPSISPLLSRPLESTSSPFSPPHPSIQVASRLISPTPTHSTPSIVNSTSTPIYRSIMFKTGDEMMKDVAVNAGIAFLSALMTGHGFEDMYTPYGVFITSTWDVRFCRKHSFFA